MRTKLIRTILASAAFLICAAPAPQSSVLSTRTPAKLQTLFNNLATRYPYGAYIAAQEYPVNGPAIQGGSQQWSAASFLAPNNTNVVKITVALYWYTGVNTVVLSLRSDKGAAPGAVLKKWTLSNLPTGPNCCAVQTVKSKGIPVQFQQRYWVVLSTNAAGADFGGGWHFNDTDQVHAAPFAYNLGHGWVAVTGIPPAFAVYASP